MQYSPDFAFSSVVGLGALKSDHTRSRDARRKSLFGQMAWTALGALLLVAGVAWIIYTGVTGSGDSSFAFLFLCLGAVFVPLGLLGIFNSWRSWQIGAALYDKGFAYKDGSGIRQVSWPEIEAVWQNITKHYRNGVYTGTTYVYTVQPKVGKRIVLDGHLASIEKLGTEIVQNSSVALYPRYVQSLQSGQRLSFGPLAMDQQGMYSGNNSLKWSEIKAVKIHQGIISVKKEGGWFNWTRVRVPQIPNFFIFYELVGKFATVE